MEPRSCVFSATFELIRVSLLDVTIILIYNHVKLLISPTSNVFIRPSKYSHWHILHNCTTAIAKDNNHLQTSMMA